MAGRDKNPSLFFFNDTATTEIYTLSLTRRSSDLEHARVRQRLGEGLVVVAHDLKVDYEAGAFVGAVAEEVANASCHSEVFPIRCDSSHSRLDRKSTRLNSSHVKISYAVFCLKKKK